MMETLNQEEVVVSAASAKDVLELPPSAPANMAMLASIRPITPDSKRESGEFLFDFASSSSSSSPLSFISSSPPKDIVEHSTSTPKEEGVSFDPFATTTTNGPPDKIILLALEHLECQRPSVGRGRRQLNFESPAKPANSHGSNAKSIPDEEDMLLETVVYETLLEAIVSKQTDESSLRLDEISVSPPPHQTSPPKTPPPTCAPHLDGVAETCPAAPMKKCTSKSRNIDRGLCRKLEF